MNDKLFKPLNEQIEVVHIKNTPITEAEYKAAVKNIIFNENIQSLTNDIKIINEMSLNEASLSTGRKLRKKLYKLKKQYDDESSPMVRERIFQKIEKLQNKMERLGFDPTVKHAEREDGTISDKKLAKATEDYENTTDPRLKDKAMNKYQKRSDKLAKKGKPSTVASMEQEKAQEV